ncbi:hypothetical protein L3476_08195 [Paenibacillus thiaminolyticus]|nr:hypothetical protein [Paenibacillus thiaminolyticus]MDG0876144.1 hypothetical protein [Paenibacillus thiaminolyticus]NGP59137.1 hypothetical protein [Paenibacillus thiaminolyticus]WCR28695.1 hypothetical protein L3476_08195 [Paenibacillus thiaminolyticus]
MDKELQEAYAALQIYLSAVEELAIANLLLMSGVLPPPEQAWGRSGQHA